MDERRQGFIDLSTKVAIMDNKIELLTEILNKLDKTLEKISDISSDTTKIVAAHVVSLEAQDERLGNHAKDDDTKFSQLLTSFKELRGDVETLKKYIWMGMGGGFVVLKIIDVISSH